MAKKDKSIKAMHRGGPPAFAFLLTYTGTLIYFLNKADNFGEVLLAFLQAAVWPALLVNKIFTVLQI